MVAGKDRQVGHRAVLSKEKHSTYGEAAVREVPKRRKCFDYGVSPGAIAEEVPSILHGFVLHKDLEAVERVSREEGGFKGAGPLFLQEARGAVSGVPAGGVGNEHTRLGVFNGRAAKSRANNLKLRKFFWFRSLGKSFGKV